VVAIQHLERVRRFKLDLAAFLLGTFVLTCVWAITEYENSGGWPSRLSDNGGAGDWNPVDPLGRGPGRATRTSASASPPGPSAPTR
jgi:hypothetical protein